MSLYLLSWGSQFSGLSSGDLVKASATAAKGSCHSRASTCCSPTCSEMDRPAVAGRLPSSGIWCATKYVVAAATRIQMKPFPPIFGSDCFESSAITDPRCTKAGQSAHRRTRDRTRRRVGAHVTRTRPRTRSLGKLAGGLSCPRKPVYARSLSAFTYHCTSCVYMQYVTRDSRPPLEGQRAPRSTEKRARIQIAGGHRGDVCPVRGGSRWRGGCRRSSGRSRWSGRQAPSR